MSLCLNTRQMAEALGVKTTLMSYWALLWQGHVGYGRRRGFDEVDLMVGFAWRELNPLATRGGAETACRELRDARVVAEAAIRERPAPWLVISPGPEAATYQHKAEAVKAWEDGLPPRRVAAAAPRRPRLTR